MPKKKRHAPKPEHVMKQAQDWCDEEDKSTGFMIAYMCDMLTMNFPNIQEDQAHDMVMDFLTTKD